MVSSLPSISLAIWLAIALSLTRLSLVSVISQSSARYPSFATLIYFATCCFTLLLVEWPEARRTHFWFVMRRGVASGKAIAGPKTSVGILAFYAYKMGISWRPRVAAIMREFAVILIVIVNPAMALLKGRTQGHMARVADDAGQIAYLRSYVYGAGVFLGKEQPVPRTALLELVQALAKESGDLEVNYTSFYPGMREEGPKRQSIKNRKFTICPTPMHY